MVENGVLVGEDGWLFLLEGSNDVRSLYCEPNAISQVDAIVWGQLLGERLSRLNAKSIAYYHMWVPDKLSIYREYLPHDFSINPYTPYETLKRGGAIQNIEHSVIDLGVAFDRAKKTHQLYWKTDTHWTYAGAYTAYETLCTAIGASARADLWQRPVHSIELTLDLGGKLSPPRKEAWSAAQVLKDSKIIYKNELVQFMDILAPNLKGALHSGASVEFENRSISCDPRRVILFGDSYSEYRPQLLSALLAETFSSVRFVWSSSLDYDLIDAYKPDIVITEMAERFLKRIPQDNLNLNQFVFEKLVTFLNGNCKSDWARFEYRQNT